MISSIDRKRIFIFVAITYGITITLGLVIFFTGGLYSNYPASFNLTHLGGLLTALMMFVPALANIATRLITREGWSNSYLRPNLRRGWRYYLAALLLPLMAIIAGGAIYYLLFPDKFDLSMPFGREKGLIPPSLAAEPWTVVVSWTILDVYRFLPIVLFLMLGEEFGWRAYLLPKLVPIGPRKAVLLVGAIWAVFHWPVLFMGYNYGFDYWGAPVAGPLLSMLVLGSSSAFYAWVTLRTGSVWPAAIGHGVNNGVGPLMAFFLKGDLDRLIGPGDWGIVGCLGYALLALAIFLSPRALAPTAPTRADPAVSGYPAAGEETAVQSSTHITF